MNKMMSDISITDMHAMSKNFISLMEDTLHFFSIKGRMGRGAFTIWYFFYVTMISCMWRGASFDDLFFCLIVFLFCFFILTNILGLLLMGVSTYDLIKDAYKYFFEYTEWLQVHFYTILKAGEFEVYLRYFMLLLTIILMALNVIQSIKRLRDMGVGIWWYLLPLYNPLALLIKKPKTS
jgi:uncharacterized membrane protein YhaH (DUF805 family)